MRDFFTQIKQKKGKDLKSFKKRILAATGAANPTWYSWISNKTVSIPFQKLISLELDQPVETLFPGN